MSFRVALALACVGALTVGTGLWLFAWLMSEIVAASQAGWGWMV